MNEDKPLYLPAVLRERADEQTSLEIPTSDQNVAGWLETFKRSLTQEGQPGTVVSTVIPWMCDVLLSEHSWRAYGKDLVQFWQHMSRVGADPVNVNQDHVKLYKAALVKAGAKPATIARRLSVIRGVYQQLAEKDIVSWETARAIATVKAPPVAKNSTPALTTQQAINLLNAVPTDRKRGARDLALLQTFFITGCRVSAITRARVGDLECDGVEHYLHVTEKRRKRARKILLDAARPILTYIECAGIANDREGPLFRPLSRDRVTFERRHLDRKTPWRIVKDYCRKAGINPERLGERGIGVHSLRKTAITDAIRNGAGMHEVREFAGHSDIRTTELYYLRREEDAELAARRIQIRCLDVRRSPR